MILFCCVLLSLLCGALFAIARLMDKLKIAEDALSIMHKQFFDHLDLAMDECIPSKQEIERLRAEVQWNDECG